MDIFCHPLRLCSEGRMALRFEIETAPEPRPVIGYMFPESSLTNRDLRRWPAEKIHVLLARPGLKPACRSMAEAELRRREAWRSPAGAGLWISAGAMLVSLTSLVASVLTG